MHFFDKENPSVIRNHNDLPDASAVSYTPHKWGLESVQSVLISTKFATEAGLIAVGGRIDHDAPDYQTVDVEIVDDAKAEKPPQVDAWRRDLLSPCS